jgi:curli biogenesis system outer membrane secretion channel CsgG
MYTSLLSTSSYHEKMADAVKNASAAISNNIPGGSTIAILNVFSNDRNLSELAMGELEYNLVNSGKFVIVDRRRLDQVRSEQNFQLSGDVSDASAVSIGNMLGANIVITGEISEAGSARRLTLRALDVKTAQIISMAREQL